MEGDFGVTLDKVETWLVCIIPWKTAIFDAASLRLMERDGKNHCLEREATHLQS